MASFRITKRNRMSEEDEIRLLKEQSSEGFELVTIVDLSVSRVFEEFKYIFRKDEGDDNKKSFTGKQLRIAVFEHLAKFCQEQGHLLEAEFDADGDFDLIWDYGLLTAHQVMKLRKILRDSVG